MNLQHVLRLGARRIEQELREAFYLGTGIDATKPLMIRAVPTERCNYKCLSCDCWRSNRFPTEMSLEQWQQALAGLKRFLGHFAIQFSGGEPFVYKPFVALVEWCAEHGIDWGVISNGSAFSQGTVERIVAARPTNVSVSVDGATSAVHDLSRGIDGSLRHVARGIALLRAERDRRRQNFPIRIKATVHRLNFHEMPAVVPWAVNTGATSIDFSPVRPWTNEVEQILWLREEDETALTQVVETLIADRRAGAPIEAEEARLRSFVNHFKGDVTLPSVAPCRAGMREFHILPNGDVRTCWFYDAIGNVAATDAKTLWKSPKATQQRATQLQCASFGSKACASSCLAHRTLAQDWQRLRLFNRSAH